MEIRAKKGPISWVLDATSRGPIPFPKPPCSQPIFPSHSKLLPGFPRAAQRVRSLPAVLSPSALHATDERVGSSSLIQTQSLPSPAGGQCPCPLCVSSVPSFAVAPALQLPSIIQTSLVSHQDESFLSAVSTPLPARAAQPHSLPSPSRMELAVPSSCIPAPPRALLGCSSAWFWLSTAFHECSPQIRGWERSVQPCWLHHTAAYSWPLITKKVFPIK